MGSNSNQQVSFNTAHLYFLSSNIIYFWQTQPFKVNIFRLSTTRVKIHHIPHVIFQTKSQFFSKFGSLFNVIRDNSSALFQMKLYMLLTKVAHQSASFQQIHHCSHKDLLNSSCHSWNQESVSFKLCITIEFHET